MKIDLKNSYDILNWHFILDTLNGCWPSLRPVLFDYEVCVNF